jgi:hypothetical protein
MSVIDGPQSVVFDEAENRLHAHRSRSSRGAWAPSDGFYAFQNTAGDRQGSRTWPRTLPSVATSNRLVGFSLAGHAMPGLDDDPRRRFRFPDLGATCRSKAHLKSRAHGPVAAQRLRQEQL